MLNRVRKGRDMANYAKIHRFSGVSSFWKQIGVICPALLFSFFVSPSYSNVGADATSADCDHNTLNVYSGTANMQEIWDANLIELHWYDEGNELNVSNSAQQCHYDDTLTVAAEPTPPTGFVFDRWALMEMQLRSLATSLDPEVDGNTNGYICHVTGFQSNANDFGLTDPGTFAVGFSSKKSSSDILFGESSCTDYGKPAQYATMAEPEAMSVTNNKASQCWCRLTRYTHDKDTQIFDYSPWVFDSLYKSGEACAQGCADECSKAIESQKTFRTTLYNNTKSMVTTAPVASAAVNPLANVDLDGKPQSRGYIDFKGVVSGSLFWVTTPGTWSVNDFKYGSVIGESSCNKIDNKNGNVAAPDVMTPTDEGDDNCWCRLTGYYHDQKSYAMTPLGGSWWVYNGTIKGCEDVCPKDCSSLIMDSEGHRFPYAYAATGAVHPLAFLDGEKSPEYGGDISLDGIGNGSYKDLGLKDNGTWGAVFDGGNWFVTGEASCNETNGTQGVSTSAWSNMDNLDKPGGQYCWCRITKHAINGGKKEQPLATSSWVMAGDKKDAKTCTSSCAGDCSKGFSSDDKWRKVLYINTGM